MYRAVVLLVVGVLLVAACTPRQGAGGRPCNADEECGADHGCVDGRCEVVSSSTPVDAGREEPADGGAPVAVDAGEDSGPLLTDAGEPPPADGGPDVDAGAVDAGEQADAAALDGGDDAGRQLPSDWLGSSHRARLALVVDLPAGLPSVPDFPLLIRVVDDRLAAFADPDGDDVLFTDADGKTLLAFEVVRFDDEAGLLEAFVRVPELGGGARTLFLYFDGPADASASDPGAVYQDLYQAVWHLDEDEASNANATLLHEDATASANDGVRRGGEPGAGVVGGALVLDGVDDWVEVAGDASLDLGGRYSLTAWVYSAQPQDGPIFASNYAPEIVLQLMNRDWALDKLQGSAFLARGPDWPHYDVWAPTGALGHDAWHHVAFVVEETLLRLYVDGEEAGTEQLEAMDLTGELGEVGLGYNLMYWSPFYFEGALDEVRATRRALSPLWIALEHANQKAPELFTGVAAFEELP